MWDCGIQTSYILKQANKFVLFPLFIRPYIQIGGQSLVCKGKKLTLKREK